MEIELRLCLLFNVKDLKNLTDKDINEFKKNHSLKNGNKKWSDALGIFICFVNKLIFAFDKS